jgi:polysaccharide export outer membrane protein
MRRFYAFAIIAILAISGCTTTRPSTYLVETKGPYQLDTGDVVRVTVYGDAELSKNYRVDDKGAIAFPLVGAVPVRGGTTEDASKRLARALANGYMRSPDVAVEVDQYRPFYIQGEIRSAGQFPYVYGMSVRAAISTAGGFTETAERENAVVYRQQGNQMVKGVVDLDFPIYPGDTIVISERWF